MPKEAAFFDFDKTISALDTEIEFTLYLLKNGQLSSLKAIRAFWLYAQYNMRLIRDYDKLKRKILKQIFSNQSVVSWTSAYEVFFENYLINAIYPEMYDIIAKHKKAERYIYIISSSLDFLIKPYCDHLKATKCYATVMEVKNGCFSGYAKDIYYGETKARIVRKISKEEGIDLSKSYGYGDHGEDKHFLTLLGHPVAVNPDKTLKRIAVAKNWDILKTSL